MRSSAFLGVVLALVSSTSLVPSALAQAVAVPSRPTLLARDQIAANISEASRHFGIPEAWIMAVMRVESAGIATAKSRAGAIGLMQVMPQTYATLRARLGLGANAYDPHDNIMAGAAYLRELHDRYGSIGFLAAYNAGPGRWEAHLAGTRRLPSETLRYVARLAPILDKPDATRLALAVAPLPIRPEAAPIFVAIGVRRANEQSRLVSPGAVQVAASESQIGVQPDELFFTPRSAAEPQSNGGPRAAGPPSSSSRPVAPAVNHSPSIAPMSSLFVPRTPSREPQP